ncbi:hypothetical protein D3C84_804940 [compost metagenome]
MHIDTWSKVHEHYPPHAAVCWNSLLLSYHVLRLGSRVSTFLIPFINSWHYTRRLKSFTIRVQTCHLQATHSGGKSHEHIEIHSTAVADYISNGNRLSHWPHWTRLRTAILADGDSLFYCWRNYGYSRRPQTTASRHSMAASGGYRIAAIDGRHGLLLLQHAMDNVERIRHSDLCESAARHCARHHFYEGIVPFRAMAGRGRRLRRRSGHVRTSCRSVSRHIHLPRSRRLLRISDAAY